MGKKKKGARGVVKLKSTSGSKTVIWTTKNNRNSPEPLELNKYDKVEGKKVLFRESKKK